jgi:hypothetical protein
MTRVLVCQYSIPNRWYPEKGRDSGEFLGFLSPEDPKGDDGKDAHLKKGTTQYHFAMLNNTDTCMVAGKSCDGNFFCHHERNLRHHERSEVISSPYRAP